MVSSGAAKFLWVPCHNRSRAASSLRGAMCSCLNLDGVADTLRLCWLFCSWMPSGEFLQVMEPQILLKYVKYPDPLIRSCQEITLPVAFPISATHSSIPRWVTTNIYKLTAQTSEVDFVAEGLQMAHEVRMKLRALRVALEWT